MRTTLALALAAALSACSTTPAPQAGVDAAAARTDNIPAYLTAPTGCAVLAGGSIGSRFTDPKIAAVWAQVNTSITNELNDRLVAGQYKVVKLLVPAERSASNQELVLTALAKHRCSRLLQISHDVNEDASGRYFRFDVELLRMEPRRDAQPAAGGHAVRTVGEFRREYRYPRTQESFDNFYTGTFAEQVLADLTRSGSLAPLR